MSFLNLQNKRFLVFGVANRKSVAYFVAKTLEAEGAEVILSVRSKKRMESVKELFPKNSFFVCDVERKEEIEKLATQVGQQFSSLNGIVHSIAFADYAKGVKSFHETDREDFLQATLISAFSIVEIANAFKPYLDDKASVVAMSISSHALSENYGYMSPIKASLDDCVRFLAKSFSKDTRVRFNTVNAGPLKTSASAGIPGYLENYLYAEKLTLRKEALNTQEVADVAVYLLSERSSGINAQGIVVNAGMDLNYFDQEIVERVMRLDTPSATLVDKE